MWYAHACTDAYTHAGRFDDDLRRRRCLDALCMSVWAATRLTLLLQTEWKTAGDQEQPLHTAATPKVVGRQAACTQLCVSQGARRKLAQTGGERLVQFGRVDWSVQRARLPVVLVDLLRLERAGGEMRHNTRAPLCHLWQPQPIVDRRFIEYGTSIQ